MFRKTIVAALALVWLPGLALATDRDCDIYANDTGQTITFTGEDERGWEGFTLDGQKYGIKATVSDDGGVFVVAWPNPHKDGLARVITFGGTVLQLGTEIFECVE